MYFVVRIICIFLIMTCVCCTSDTSMPETTTESIVITGPNERNIANCSNSSQTNTNDSSAVSKVVLANSSLLLEQLTPDRNIRLSNESAQCVVVFYFATHCPFSVSAAPHVNAVAKVFPAIRFYAIDAYNDQLLNVNHGISGTPTMNLFHNGKLRMFYNSTEFTLKLLIEFFETSTNLEANSADPRLDLDDFVGPIPTVLFQDVDYVLILCWLFISACVIYYYSFFEWFYWLIDNIKVSWIESAALHSHDE